MKPHIELPPVVVVARCRGCGHDLNTRSGIARHNVRCAIDGERSYQSARTKTQTED